MKWDQIKCETLIMRKGMITEHQLRNNNIRASGISAVPEQGLEGRGHRICAKLRDTKNRRSNIYRTMSRINI